MPSLNKDTHHAILWYERNKARMRVRYRLARDLGFPVSEARRLSSRSEAAIRALAEERAAYLTQPQDDEEHAS